MEGEGCPAQRVVHERSVRQLLRKAGLSESFVVGRYRFSPYMACEHACAYCDGRAERYYVEGDFTRDIVARTNAPTRLEEELPRLRERGFITLGSGISDVYQPVERELLLTRGCLEVLAQHPFPVTVMTKSALALRDLDLWKRLADGPGCLIIVSLTFARDEERAHFEPGASSVEERLELLQRCREAGCRTGVLAMPLLPWITDTDEAIGALYGRLRAVAPDFIMPAGLTLRPGRQKDHFFDVLAQYDPGLVDRYRGLYGENRPSGATVAGYREKLTKRLNDHIRNEGIPFLVPHRLFAPKLHAHDSLQVLLAHMIEIYTARGVDTGKLVDGRKRYMAWLEARKRWYDRRRSASYDRLDDELAGSIRTGEMGETLANEKLARFVESVVVDRQVFDYVTCELGEPSRSRNT